MKKNFSLTIFLVIIFELTSFRAQQSKITFEHIKSVPNMPCIFQDQTGYIWCGTYWGIHRYDPYSFKSYIPRNTDTTSLFNQVVTDIPNLIIMAICGDKEGNIWAGHSQGLEKLNSITGQVTHYRLNPNTSLTDPSNSVSALLEDSEGSLWIGTEDGLYLLDRKTETFKWIRHDSTDSHSLIHNSVNAIYEDRSGNLLFGTGEGLDKLDQSGKFVHYCTDVKNPDSDDGFSRWVVSLFEDRDGLIWIGTSSGLVEFNRKTGSYILYKHDPKNPGSLADNYVKSISEDIDGNLWISTDGVDIFNKRTKKFFHYKYDPNDPGSISGNNTAKILCDISGAIWVTTYGRGLNKVTLGKRYVREYPFDKYGDLKDPTWNLAEDYQGKIWIGTDRGLISFDLMNEVFKEEKLKTDISGLIIDKTGTLWISSRTTGNLFFKKDREEKFNLFIDSQEKIFPEGLSFMSNCNDGNIWLANYDNVLKLFPYSRKVEQIIKVDNWITYLYEDKTGLLWIGTNVGLICYNPENKTSTRFSYDSNDSLTIGGNAVSTICEDGFGNVWVTANSTLNKFDREKQKYIRWSGKDGLPETAFELETDIHGNLWIFNGNAIKYDPVTKETKVFADVKFGTPYKTRSGEFYLLVTRLFGDKQSLIRFNPDSLRNNEFVAPIVITDFRKFEKSSPFGKEIRLPFNENFLSFEFAVLSYVHQEKNQYAYKMEGVDKDWVYSNTRRYASYPNMEPGEYIFRVKGSNNEGVWNEEGTSIAIIISPPWWKTWWAYSSYSLIFVFALYGIRKYELNRAGLKNKILMNEVVLKEKEETNKMKSRFFANISHEFRTPLTLILGPAEKIFSNTSDNHIKDADIIRRNSRRLLQLINQLLDLSKLEAGKLKLEASKGNIVSFVKGVALSFESLAESKDISLKIISEKDFIEMYFDKEKMMKILTNILSNAFKFTPEEGKIEVSVSLPTPKSLPEEGTFKGVLSPPLEGRGVGQKKVDWDSYVSISIRDTGIGISQEEIPKLFDRFYQVDSSHTREYEGTGIGLALTKELVELHSGSIKVESEKGIFTEFTLEFPLGKDHLKGEKIIEEKSVASGVILSESKNLTPEIINNSHIKDFSSSDNYRIPRNDNEKEDKTIILIVEDNYDMRQYIRESLDGNYLVEEAVNGKQGVRKAEKIIPDLIISDMMMPKMDGNELVKILKNDEKTSHIPIILLTAKAGHENKLDGLEIGADDYLTKPFDIKELQIRIKNLINIRKLLQKKFSKIAIQMPEIPRQKFSSLDEKFMIRIGEVIEKHISEEEFDIEEFCREAAMSRTQLHRKLKALTGKSASIYVRSVKLNKAKNMIEDQSGNISEVAYSLGFSSLSYFSKCFKEEFGYPPSEVKK